MHYSILIKLLATALFLSNSFALQAQVSQAEGAKSPEIIVEGDRPLSPRKVKQQARQITADRNLRNVPLARFEKPVCPGVIGLPLDLAGPIVIRVREVARAIGLDAADSSDCSPNILIVFTGDGKADLEELAEKDRSLLSGLSFWERKRLLREDGPTRAFSVVATKSNSGMGSTSTSPVFQTTLASRIYLSTRRDIDVAVVLIDADAADGKTVTQLADFAAMRTYARTKPPTKGTEYDTILTLFDEGVASPVALTNFDVAYLKAVYAGQPNRAGNSKLGQVAKELEETSD